MRTRPEPAAQSVSPKRCATWFEAHSESPLAAVWCPGTPSPVTRRAKTESRSVALFDVRSGQRRPQRGEERVYQQIEIEHGPFRRVVALGVDVDSDAAQASYEDGILTVELPVAQPTPGRTVPIQRGEDT